MPTTVTNSEFSFYSKDKSNDASITKFFRDLYPDESKDNFLERIFQIDQMRKTASGSGIQIVPKKFIASSTDVGNPLLTAETAEAIPMSIRFNWHALANSGLTYESYSYILRLAKKKAGWRGKGSKALNGDSLSNFLIFWCEVESHSKEPEFSLLPNGNIQAEWYKNNNHFSEIEFKDNGKVLFGFFDGKNYEVEGEADINDLFSIVSRKNFRILKWKNASQEESHITPKL